MKLVKLIYTWDQTIIKTYVRTPAVWTVLYVLNLLVQYIDSVKIIWNFGTWRKKNTS